MKVNKHEIWQQLQLHQKQLEQQSLASLFLADADRFKKFSLSFNGLLMDYSKQSVDVKALSLLMQLARTCDLEAKIQTLFEGGIVNISEQRPALHMALRANPPNADVRHALSKIEGFVGAVRQGTQCGATNKPITDVICLGIGGSDLGPLMVNQALQPYAIESALKMHFISNVDAQTRETTLEKLNPETTLCLVNSKTFTTIETLSNATKIKTWLCDALGKAGVSKQLFAVTTNIEKAKDFGIPSENIFEFWDWVGGRYSVWSAVGLPLALQLGMEQFKAFLQGAHEMDCHFKEVPLEKNLPVVMALIGVWNINFFNRKTLAVIPYIDGLAHFPEYLQQLEMESNGKSVTNQNEVIGDYQTAPVIWGGVGCNGQHAYMQLLHQGTQIIPVDFIASVKNTAQDQSQQSLLLASCFGQSQALMQGQLKGESDLPKEKVCPGNRPSTTLLFQQLTPKAMGMLLALYEHKVFVQGVIWDINSFDQWGVELGKTLIKQLQPYLQGAPIEASLDISTKGLIDYFLASSTN